MLSIVIPTYKEYVNTEEIGEVFTGMGYDVQVVVSTDEEPHVGKGNAIREGVEHSQGSHILFMDNDLQIPPQEIYPFFKIMELYNADAVIGNKYHPYSNIQYTWWRRIVSVSYRLLVKFLFDLHIKDTQCGFKLFKKEPLLLIMDKLITDRYATDLEIIIALRDNGFRVVDAPVYVKKQVNKGSVSIDSIIVMIIDTFRIWWHRQGGWYVK